MLDFQRSIYCPLQWQISFGVFLSADRTLSYDWFGPRGITANLGYIVFTRHLFPPVWLVPFIFELFTGPLITWMLKNGHVPAVVTRAINIWFRCDAIPNLLASNDRLLFFVKPDGNMSIWEGLSVRVGSLAGCLERDWVSSVFYWTRRRSWVSGSTRSAWELLRRTGIMACLPEVTLHWNEYLREYFVELSSN
jgi:hypothetical protein